MFSRVFALIPLALLTSAAPQSSGSSQCNTASAMCCQTSGQSNSPAIQNAIPMYDYGGLLGNILASVDVLVGLDCDGIVGDGADCSQSPMCCQYNMNEGLVTLGCSPITADL